MPKQHGIQDAGVSQSIESAESTNFIKVDWEKSPPNKRGADHESARGGVDPCCLFGAMACDLVAGGSITLSSHVTVTVTGFMSMDV